MGNHIFISGTVGVDQAGRAVAPGAYEQSKRAFEIIEEALAELGAALSDVTRTRIFLTDIARDADAAGKAHAEAFGSNTTLNVPFPACTMVEVSALINPELCVEIEAEAVLSGSG